MINCFIDTETTGLDPVQNTITSIGLVVDVDGETVFEKTYFSAPSLSKIIEEEALEVQDRTLDQVRAYPKASFTAHQFYKDFLMINANYGPGLPWFIGYNVQFDFNFLLNWMKENSNQSFKSLFQKWPVDVATIVIWLKHLGVWEKSDCKLVTAVKYLLPQYSHIAHEALEDARATRELYYYLIGRLKGSLSPHCIVQGTYSGEKEASMPPRINV
jgi:DNA polymerase III epsilon subunit-like protein